MKIIVTGPSTIAAILNSFQIGFRTLALQKRSSEVWDVLIGVKKEFWNKKVGKDLMLFTESLVIKRGLKSIRLDTYSGNLKAMQFYIRLGYTELGTINLKPNKDKYYCFEKIVKSRN